MKNGFVTALSLMMVMGLSQAKAQTPPVSNDSSAPAVDHPIKEDNAKIKETREKLQGLRKDRNEAEGKVKEAREKLREDVKVGASADQKKDDVAGIKDAKQVRHEKQKDVNETRHELRKEQKERHSDVKEKREGRGH